MGKTVINKKRPRLAHFKTHFPPVNWWRFLLLVVDRQSSGQDLVDDQLERRRHHDKHKDSSSSESGHHQHHHDHDGHHKSSSSSSESFERFTAAAATVTTTTKCVGCIKRMINSDDPNLIDLNQAILYWQKNWNNRWFKFLWKKIKKSMRRKQILCTSSENFVLIILYWK